MSIIIGLLMAAVIGIFVYEEFRQLKKNNVVRHLIEVYEHDLENPVLIDTMYDYACKDRKLKKIVAKYQATREDFDDLFHRLLEYGNFRKINRFVPIHSFFSVNSLEYLLSHREQTNLELTKKMFNYFNI